MVTVHEEELINTKLVEINEGKGLNIVFEKNDDIHDSYRFNFKENFPVIGHHDFFEAIIFLDNICGVTTGSIAETKQARIDEIQIELDAVINA